MLRFRSTGNVIACALAVLGPAACGGSEVGSLDGSGGVSDAAVVDTPEPIAPDAAPSIDASRRPPADAGPPLLNDAGQPLCSDGGGTLVACECGDGADNDGDTRADGADPECSGPFDNDESSFATGIPGDNSDPWVQDCFFDGDSGGGNDHCRWDIRCVAPPDGSHCNNNQLDGCDLCRGLTPNGCDCFGCCEVYVGDVAHRVRIVDTCSVAVIDDPALCPPCEPVADCSNPCDPCEYCLGHEPDPSCTSVDGGVPGPCPDGVVPCGSDGSCADGFGCVTGCCRPIVL